MTEEKKLIDFIKKSPSCFHVVKNFENELSDKGFEKLEEGKKWNIKTFKGWLCFSFFNLIWNKEFFLQPFLK